jgi:hypothetical protein
LRNCVRIRGEDTGWDTGRFNCRQSHCLRSSPILLALRAPPWLTRKEHLWRLLRGGKWQCKSLLVTVVTHVLHHQNFLPFFLSHDAWQAVYLFIGKSFWANDRLLYDCRLLKYGPDTYDKMADFDLSFIPALYTPSALLPIARHKKSLLYTIETHQVTVLIGQTGSGKTTQLPQFLHQAGWTSSGKCIAVTQVGESTLFFWSDCI